MGSGGRVLEGGARLHGRRRRACPCSWPVGGAEGVGNDTLSSELLSCGGALGNLIPQGEGPRHRESGYCKAGTVAMQPPESGQATSRVGEDDSKPGLVRREERSGSSRPRAHPKEVSVLL